MAVVRTTNHHSCQEQTISTYGYSCHTIFFVCVPDFLCSAVQVVVFWSWQDVFLVGKKVTASHSFLCQFFISRAFAVEFSLPLIMQNRRTNAKSFDLLPSLCNWSSNASLKQARDLLTKKKKHPDECSPFFWSRFCHPGSIFLPGCNITEGISKWKTSWLSILTEIFFPRTSRKCKQ